MSTAQWRALVSRMQGPLFGPQYQANKTKQPDWGMQKSADKGVIITPVYKGDQKTQKIFSEWETGEGKCMRIWAVVFAHLDVRAIS